MKRRQLGEEKTISILKEATAGASATDLRRPQSVAENIIYPWKAMYFRANLFRVELHFIPPGEPT